MAFCFSACVGKDGQLQPTDSLDPPLARRVLKNTSRGDDLPDFILWNSKHNKRTHPFLFQEDLCLRPRIAPNRFFSVRNHKQISWITWGVFCCIGTPKYLWFRKKILPLHELVPKPQRIKIEKEERKGNSQLRLAFLSLENWWERHEVLVCAAIEAQTSGNWRWGWFFRIVCQVAASMFKATGRSLCSNKLLYCLVEHKFAYLPLK